MAKDREQIMKELESLKGEVEELKEIPSKGTTQNTEESITVLMKYMVEERGRTNRRLDEINDKIMRLRSAVESMYAMEEETDEQERRDVILSGLDNAVLDFVQSRGMVCADDLVEFMKYKGRNAACTRLSRLYMRGLLERHQVGHKVYYKYNAGKATNTLIISPPQ